jgi:hypothetical protein
MDDGKYERRSRNGGLSLAFLTLTISLVLQISIVSVSSLDSTLENIREEGLEKHDISIFVEKKVEFIHSRISLKPLISAIDHGHKLCAEFSVRANSTLGRILSSKLRNSVIRIDKKLDKMLSRNSNRVTRTARSRRAIEFMGNLISKLFGNPGPEEWRQNTRNLLAMKSAIDRQMSNSIILHRDIDQNRHAINEQNEILKLVSKDVLQNSNRLHSVDNALLEFETYLELDMMFNAVLVTLQMLDNIRVDSKRGRCNEDGVNGDFLVEHLREIESNKLGIAPIFASWEWRKYYENNMCSIAVHDNDVWITMRIPIVNLAEQLVRVTPLSGQIWIRDTLYQFGLETTLLKNKRDDVYMTLTKNSLEGCSKLDIFRVCNIRETKFRPARPLVVPIDIGHNRVVVISNSTDLTVASKVVCNGVTTSLEIHSETVLSIPEKCYVVGKSFEISKNIDEINVSDTVKLQNTEMVLSKRINRVGYKSEIYQAKNLPELSKDFEKNNNETIESLKSIKFTHTETMLIAMTGSSTILLISVALVLLVIYCWSRKKYNRIGHNCPNAIVLDLENRQKNLNDESAMNDLSRRNLSANSVLENKECDDLDIKEIEKSKDVDTNKPLFQRKR